VRNTFNLPKFSGSSNILFKDLEHGYNAVDVAIVQNQKDYTALLQTCGYIPVHKNATQPWRNLHFPIVHGSKKLRYPAAETKAVVMESSETNSCPDDDAEHVRKQGNQLFKIGNFEAALLAFKQACVLLPSCRLAPSNAAQSALEMGEYQQALDFGLQGFQRENFLCVQEDIHVHVCNAAWRYVFVRVLQIELCAFFSYLYMCPDMHLHMNTYIHMYVHFYIFLNIHAEYHRIALEDNPVLIRMHICLQRALQPTEIYDCNPQHTLYIGTTP